MRAIHALQVIFWPDVMVHDDEDIWSAQPSITLRSIRYRAFPFPWALRPYQINSFVLGLEFDLDGATGSKYANAALTNVPESFVSPAITRSAQQLD